MVAAAVLGCGRPSGAPAAALPVPAALDPAPRLSALTPEAVRVCLEYPTELVAVEGGRASLFKGNAGSIDPLSRTELTSVPLPGHHAFAPTQHTFAILVYRGRSTFKEHLEKAKNKEGEPPLTRNMITMPVDVAPGRPAQLSFVGIMMSGALVWATLPSPRKTYDLTLYIDRPLHDSVHDKDGEPPFEALIKLTEPDQTLPRALRCLDHLLWP